MTQGDVRARLVGVAYFLFNLNRGDAAPRPGLRAEAIGFLQARMWGIDAEERHGSALAAADLILVYLGAPDWKLIGGPQLPPAGS